MMLSNPPAEQKGTEQVPASAAGPCQRSAQSSLYHEQLIMGCRDEIESGEKELSTNFDKGIEKTHSRSSVIDVCDLKACTFTLIH